MPHINPIPLRLLLTICLALALTPCAFAQSNASQVSQISLQPSVASVAVKIEALPAGSQLIVTVLRPVGGVIELSVETAGHVAISGLKVSAATARATGLVVGTTLSVVTVSAGVLLCAGSEALTFLPDSLAQTLIHDREL